MKWTYRGYTIEPDKGWLGYQSGPSHIHFYPTEEGIQDDADYDGEKYKYCGNREWVDSVDEAKHRIDEILGPTLNHGLQLVNKYSGLTVTVKSWDVVTDTVIVILSCGQEANYSVSQITELCKLTKK